MFSTLQFPIDDNLLRNEFLGIRLDENPPCIERHTTLLLSGEEGELVEMQMGDVDHCADRDGRFCLNSFDLIGKANFVLTWKWMV